MAEAEERLRERLGVFEWQRRLRQDAKASGLRPASLGSLMILATFADPDGGNAFPSASKLGEALGMRRDTIGTAWTDGVRCGWLRVEGVSQRGTKVYALTAPLLPQGGPVSVSGHAPETAHVPESRHVGVGGHAPVSGPPCPPESAGADPDRAHNQSLYLSRTSTSTALGTEGQEAKDEQPPMSDDVWALAEQEVARERAAVLEHERDVAARWAEFQVSNWSR